MLFKRKIVLGLFASVGLACTISSAVSVDYPKIRPVHYKIVLQQGDRLEVQGEDIALYCAMRRNSETGKISYQGHVDATVRERSWADKPVDKHLSSVFGVDAVHDPRVAMIHKMCLDSMDTYNNRK